MINIDVNTSSVFRGGHAAMPPPLPPRKVRKHFLTRYTVKTGISNLYILPSKCRKCRFRDPNFKIFLGGHAPGPPTIVSSLWPPPH